MSDEFLDSYLKFYGDKIKKTPSIYYVWSKAQLAVEQNNEEVIKIYENLIFLLFNSIVSPRVRLGKNVKFAYGGIGTVIHKNSIIGNDCAIGQGVTIGGSPGKFGLEADGSRFFVPRIDNHSYIAAGCRILGGVKIGKFCVIGVNSVVIGDVENYSVIAGQPARLIKRITKKNCLNYRSFFTGTKGLDVVDYISLFPEN